MSRGDGTNTGDVDVIGQTGGHIGFHETRGDRTDGNATTSQLPGRGLDQANETRFGGSITDLPCIAYLSSRGVDIGDPPTMLAGHDLGGLVDTGECAA